MQQQEPSVICINGTTPKNLPPLRIPQRGALCATDREYSCLISHLRALQYALESTDDPYIMICEDDINFQWFSKDEIERHIETAPEDWECLQCFTNNPNVIFPLAYKYNDDGELWHPWQPRFWSTLLYIMKRESAQRLVDTFGTFDFRSLNKGKLVADDVLYRNLRTYTTTLPLVSSNDEYGSHIHPKHMSLHRQAHKTQEIVRWYIPKNLKRP